MWCFSNNDTLSKSIHTGYIPYRTSWSILVVFTHLIVGFCLNKGRCIVSHPFHLARPLFPSRGATNFSKLGSPVPWSRISLPFYRKIRQVYPVWCSRLHNHTVFIKSYVECWASIQLLGRSGTRAPRWLHPCSDPQDSIQVELLCAGLCDTMFTVSNAIMSRQTYSLSHCRV